MRLSSMRYKNYTWPHNPETFVVEYRRQMAAHKVPFGGCVLQDLGVNCRILRGEGCLLYTSPSPRDGLLSRMPSSA